MKFIHYKSIENHYQQKFIDKILCEGLAGGQWHVSEKTHGANFGVYYNGSEVRYAKRTSFIDLASSFFGFQSLAQSLDTLAKMVWATVNVDKTDQIVIYGELCGGYYAHPEVEKTTASKVQREIDYSPKLEFVLFDILVVKDGVEEFMDADRVDSFNGVVEGIRCAPHIFTGTLEECLKVPNEFITKVPEMYGLPPIEGNTCEGVVIKPVKACFLSDGSRVIIKSKNLKFSEKKKVPNPKVPQDPTLSPELKEIVDKLAEYVNDARMASVCSKLGDVTIKDFGKVLRALVNDVFEEAKGDIDLKGMDGRVGKMVTKMCAELTKKHLTCGNA